MKEGYVYILRFQESGKYYTGSCYDIFVRLYDHERGSTRTTRIGGPWTLELVLWFPIHTEAVSFERSIKKWKSRNKIQTLVEHSR